MMNGSSSKSTATRIFRAGFVTSLLLAGAAFTAGCTNDQAKKNDQASTTGASATAAAPAAPMPSMSSAAMRTLAGGNTIRRESYGCFLSMPSSNPADKAASFEVDCPQNLLQPGDPAPVARRPAGKEDWIRVTPWAYFDMRKNECAYTSEWFCSPPGKFAQCMPAPKPLPVGCTRNLQAGTLDIAAFTWVDGTGACHKVAATTCKLNRRNLCELPEGEIVACDKANAPAK
jgi:hypothetical protein